MEATIELSRPAAPDDLTFSRLFRAPRDLVWKAWIDPVQVAAWWGPHGFSNPRCSVDPRPGGDFHVDMLAKDGTVRPLRGHFIDLEPLSRLVLVTSLPDTGGTVAVEHRHDMRLSQEDGRTRMTLRSRLIRAAPSLVPHGGDMEQSWAQSLERLCAILKAI